MSTLLAELKSCKIAVLMGGRSGEREISLRSGTKVFESLKAQGFNVIAIDVDRNLPDVLREHKIEIAYIALHGKGGEDGEVQGLLEMLGIKYTGSGILASALSMDKVAAKKIFLASNIATPKFMTVDPHNLNGSTAEIIRTLTFPIVVKPHSEGSSLGVTVVKTPADLARVISETQKKYTDVFVEEFIAGTEVTVGIIGCGQNLRALPILELLPKNEFYDFESKYTPGMTDFVLPARLPEKIYKETQQIALRAHLALGCRGVSRVDILVKGGREPYVTEINSSPGMTDQSDLPAEAREAGMTFDQLVLEILQSAL
ncbi:MAG: D-alanine--D-alanine ligase [Candidatus Margulisiibacteriota bacterium]